MKSENNYEFNVAVGKMREKAVSLHYQRYMEVGFFKKGEADPYEKSSIYFSVQPAGENEVVGVTRLITTEMAELPTFKHFKIYDIERARLNQIDQKLIAEISAFTKMPEHDVGLGLIKTVLQYSLTTGLSHWICCIDERVYKYMHRMFKFPFKVIGESQVYLGSTTIPCLLNLADCLSTLKEHRPALYEFLLTGYQDTAVGIAK